MLPFFAPLPPIPLLDEHLRHESKSSKARPAR
jgi:hypothetical protein